MAEQVAYDVVDQAQSVGNAPTGVSGSTTYDSAIGPDGELEQ